jgi:hypothetical protein
LYVIYKSTPPDIVVTISRKVVWMGMWHEGMGVERKIHKREIRRQETAWTSNVYIEGRILLN